VTPAGDGNYTVTTQVRGGMTPRGEVKASSLKRADEYCSQKGKRLRAPRGVHGPADAFDLVVTDSPAIRETSSNTLCYRMV